MQPESQALINDALRTLELLARITAEKSADDYAADEMLRAAVERTFTIVGEALSQLRRRDPDVAGQIPGLPEAIGLRNILVHGYAVVNDDVLWLTVTDDAPPLAAALQRLLDAEA